MEDGEHPLLSPIQDDQSHNQPHDSQIHGIASNDEQDRVGSNKPIPYFFREFYEESKKLWYLAAPAILTSGCQYSLGAVTQVFAGQLGTTELAMFSVENSIIAGFGNRPMSMVIALTFISSKLYSLGTWYVMALVLFAGYLKNAEVSVDASGICINIMGWTVNMVGFGLSAAIRFEVYTPMPVRVSNELGASHPKAARFSALVLAVTSILIGVAIGAGWQAYVAYVNLGCYYLLGIPLCLLMAFKFNMGIQILILCKMQAGIVGDRLKQWGGETDDSQS
ncbi:hypothetical protein RHSIM_Rhsim12G0111100 [Rhododendron simsii]|uniref:Multi antimicrobial extrusion protein n=1 Tax=Rhododendron simsii TaxID=118357 RepID=A0A834L909_RHOSS|nr:hypothetical protein RHSIM_Rhsim12G0111100 [Rhododendron simsii]